MHSGYHNALLILSLALFSSTLAIPTKVVDEWKRDYRRAFDLLEQNPLGNAHEITALADTLKKSALLFKNNALYMAAINISEALSAHYLLSDPTPENIKLVKRRMQRYILEGRTVLVDHIKTTLKKLNEPKKIPTTASIETPTKKSPTPSKPPVPESVPPKSTTPKPVPATTEHAMKIRERSRTTLENIDEILHYADDVARVDSKGTVRGLPHDDIQPLIDWKKKLADKSVTQNMIDEAQTVMYRVERYLTILDGLKGWEKLNDEDYTAFLGLLKTKARAQVSSDTLIKQLQRELDSMAHLLTEEAPPEIELLPKEELKTASAKEAEKKEEVASSAADISPIEQLGKQIDAELLSEAAQALPKYHADLTALRAKLNEDNYENIKRNFTNLKNLVAAAIHSPLWPSKPENRPYKYKELADRARSLSGRTLDEKEIHIIINEILDEASGFHKRIGKLIDMYKNTAESQPYAAYLISLQKSVPLGALSADTQLVEDAIRKLTNAEHLNSLVEGDPRYANLNYTLLFEQLVKAAQSVESIDITDSEHDKQAQALVEQIISKATIAPSKPAPKRKSKKRTKETSPAPSPQLAQLIKNRDALYQEIEQYMARLTRPEEKNLHAYLKEIQDLLPQQPIADMAEATQQLAAASQRFNNIKLLIEAVVANRSFSSVDKTVIWDQIIGAAKPLEGRILTQGADLDNIANHIIEDSILGGLRIF